MEGFRIDKIVEEVQGAIDDVSRMKIVNDIQSAMDDLSEQLSDLGIRGNKWDSEGDQETGSAERIEQEFEVGPNPSLSVTNVSGQIRIHAEPGSVIRVRASKHGSGRARASTQVDVQVENNRVNIQTKGDPSGMLGFSRHLSPVDYEREVHHHFE